MDKETLLDKWTFSTNVVSIMGIHKVRCIGFGLGRDNQARAPNEITYKNELMIAVAVCAAIPLKYTELMNNR